MPATTFSNMQLSNSRDESVRKSCKRAWKEVK